MGKIVNFDQAKKAHDEKKMALEKRRHKNAKLAKKMKRQSTKFQLSPIYFYLALIAVISIIVLITKIQP